MTHACLHCGARPTDKEIAEGWCEGCGKKLSQGLFAAGCRTEEPAAWRPVGPLYTASGIGRLPAYPGNRDQSAELPPATTALPECLAGAILGTLVAGVGSVLAGCDPATMLLGLLLGSVIGALDGLLVAKLFGKRGTTVSVGSVLWAVPRVLLWTCVWPVLPPIIMLAVLGRGRRRFFERVDEWDQGGD